MPEKLIVAAAKVVASFSCCSNSSWLTAKRRVQATAIIVIIDEGFDVSASDLRDQTVHPDDSAMRVIDSRPLSGFARPEDIDRAIKTGFFSHMTKPFDFDALALLLTKLPRCKRKGRSDAVASLLRLYRIAVLPREIKCKNHHRCY